MEKVRCEVCMGLGLASEDITLSDEICTSCNGKGSFDSPDDSIDQWIDAATRITPNWRNVSREIVKFQRIRIRKDF